MPCGSKANRNRARTVRGVSLPPIPPPSFLSPSGSSTSRTLRGSSWQRRTEICRVQHNRKWWGGVDRWVWSRKTQLDDQRHRVPQPHNTASVGSSVHSLTLYCKLSSQPFLKNRAKNIDGYVLEKQYFS